MSSILSVLSVPQSKHCLQNQGQRGGVHAKNIQLLEQIFLCLKSLFFNLAQLPMFCRELNHLLLPIFNVQKAKLHLP